MRASFGGFIYDFEEEQRSVSFANQASNNFVSGSPTDIRIVKNQAVFGTLDFDVSDQIELSLEARYQSEEKGLTTAGGYDESVTFKDFIPKAIISYDAGGLGNFYASYAKGIKPGGINGPTGQPGPGGGQNFEFYEPEEADNFEQFLLIWANREYRLFTKQYISDHHYETDLQIFMTKVFNFLKPNSTPELRQYWFRTLFFL